jgi:hypothetical protein
VGTSRLLAILVDVAGLAVLAACSARLTGSRRAALVAAGVMVGAVVRMVRSCAGGYLAWA